MSRREGVRILVALDESPRSAAALLAAAAMAAELDAELAGLFIEDINLQHLASLPFAREISLLSGVGRPVSRGEVEQTWRREAETMQRRLAEAAGRLRVRWSFRVARGRVFAEVTTQAQAYDLIVLGKRTRFGLMKVAQVNVAGVYPKVQGRPVLVLFEDLESSAQSLDVAAKLARRDGVELVLMIRAGSEDAYRAACAEAQAALRGSATNGRCTWLPVLDGPRLIQAVRREAAGCLVLAHRERLLAQEGFEQVLDEIDCPTVLIR